MKCLQIWLPFIFFPFIRWSFNYILIAKSVGIMSLKFTECAQTWDYSLVSLRLEFCVKITFSSLLCLLKFLEWTKLTNCFKNIQQVSRFRSEKLWWNESRRSPIIVGKLLSCLHLLFAFNFVNEIPRITVSTTWSSLRFDKISQQYFLYKICTLCLVKKFI